MEGGGCGVKGGGCGVGGVGCRVWGGGWCEECRVEGVAFRGGTPRCPGNRLCHEENKT